MIHGLVQTTYVPDNLQLAWHIVGKQICLPHALLLVADLFFRLHHFDYSPFVVFSQLQLQRFQGRTTHLVDFPGGSFVSLSADIPTNPHVTTLLHCVRESAPFTCWHPRSGFEPPIVEDSYPLPAQEAEAVSIGTISPTAYGSLCGLCPKLTVSMPSPFGVMPPSRATHWKPWFAVHLSWTASPWTWQVVCNWINFVWPVWSHRKPTKDAFWLVRAYFTHGCWTLSVVAHLPFRWLRSATLEMHWDPSLHDTIVLIDCPSPGVSLLVDFWTSLFSCSQLEAFGLLCQTEPEVGGIRPFVPGDSLAVVPPAAFHLALSIAAVHSVFCLLPVSSLVFVRLNWHSRPLWAGHLSSDCTIQLILNILGMGMGTILQTEAFSLVQLVQQAHIYRFPKFLWVNDGLQKISKVASEARGNFVRARLKRIYAFLGNKSRKDFELVSRKGNWTFLEWFETLCTLAVGFYVSLWPSGLPGVSAPDLVR